MRNTKEIEQEIIQYFEDNTDIFNRCIEELDGYNGILGDDRCYDMDCFDELHYGKDPWESARAVFFGEDEHGGTFNPTRDYWYYNAYGNLVSCDEPDYSNYNGKYTVYDLRDHRSYIGSIDDDPELCALFDEYEEAAKTEETEEEEE